MANGAFVFYVIVLMIELCSGRQHPTSSSSRRNKYTNDVLDVPSSHQQLEVPASVEYEDDEKPSE